MTAKDGNKKSAGKFSADFQISAGRGIEDYVDAALRAWITHFPSEVDQFILEMDEWRAEVNLCNASGAVKGVNEKGEHQFDVPLVLPITLHDLLIHIFGRDYLKDKKIFERLKKQFKVGRLNANFHQPTHS